MFVDPCIIVQFIKKNPTRCTSVATFYHSYFYESQHVSGDTPPIIRGLKLHWQPLVFYTWKVVGRVVGGLCQAQCDSQCPPTTRPTTFHVWKTRGCQCSFRLLMMGGVLPETCWASYKYGIIKFWYTVASCWIFLYELYYDAWIHEHQDQRRKSLQANLSQHCSPVYLCPHQEWRASTGVAWYLQGLCTTPTSPPECPCHMHPNLLVPEFFLHQSRQWHGHQIQACKWQNFKNLPLWHKVAAAKKLYLQIIQAENKMYIYSGLWGSR